MIRADASAPRNDPKGLVGVFTVLTIVPNVLDARSVSGKSKFGWFQG
jgi:hypothetical protein